MLKRSLFITLEEHYHKGNSIRTCTLVNIPPSTQPLQWLLRSPNHCPLKSLLFSSWSRGYWKFQRPGRIHVQSISLHILLTEENMTSLSCSHLAPRKKKKHTKKQQLALTTNSHGPILLMEVAGENRRAKWMQHGAIRNYWNWNWAWNLPWEHWQSNYGQGPNFKPLPKDTTSRHIDTPLFTAK